MRRQLHADMPVGLLEQFVPAQSRGDSPVRGWPNPRKGLKLPDSFLLIQAHALIRSPVYLSVHHQPESALAPLHPYDRDGYLYRVASPETQGFGDAPRDKCAHFREINGTAAAFQYLQKNYNPTASSFL